MAQFDDVIILHNFTAVDFTVAAVAGRLVNFQTGQSLLRPGHMLWLQQEVVPAILARPNAWIDFFGFASKRGNTQFNLALSRNRATAAKNFIDVIMKLNNSSIDGKVNIDQGFGEDHPDYIAGEDDNSAHWRAAEVLVFGTRPKIVRRPPVPKKENNEFEIRVVAGGSASIFAQADNYFFQIVDVTRQRTMFYQYTGFGLGVSIPKIPGPGSITKAGPPAKFTTSRSAELFQFNSPASLFQDYGATFGSKSFHGNLRLSINEITDHNGIISTAPGIIEIEGGWGVQMPGAGSATQGVLAKVSDEFPFTGY